MPKAGRAAVSAFGVPSKRGYLPAPVPAERLPARKSGFTPGSKKENSASRRSTVCGAHGPQIGFLPRHVPSSVGGFLGPFPGQQIFHLFHGVPLPKKIEYPGFGLGRLGPCPGLGFRPCLGLGLPDEFLYIVCPP